MSAVYPYSKDRFIIEVNNKVLAKVTEVTGCEEGVDEIEYREGNERPTPRHVQGIRKFSNVTLKYGSIEGNGLYEWLNPQNENAVIERRNVLITLLAEDMSTPVAVWQIESAWPIKYKGPDLNDTVSEEKFESIELAHEGIKRIK